MGILISNNGTITLPCALFILGIPLLAIGQYRCNKEEALICYYDTKGRDDVGVKNGVIGYVLSAFSFTTTTTFTSFYDKKPYQWTLGFIFLIIAIILVILESSFFRKNILKTANAKRGGAAGENLVKDEYDIETELMSTHYTQDEIMNQIQTIVNRHIQQSFGKENISIGKDNGNDHPQGSQTSSKIQWKKMKKLICCLNALALKIDAATKNTNIAMKKGDINMEQQQKEQKKHINDIYKKSQEASYIILRTFSNHDELISASLSLLALCAKSDSVRQRHLKNKKSYELGLPINIMHSSLQRSKKVVAEEEKEQLAAEIQRKGCIFLGGLSDGNKNLASHIVQCGGLECILESIDWFRYHLYVINWSLWSIFNLCYDHMGNKGELIRLDGVGKICRAMKNVLSNYDEEEKDSTVVDKYNSDEEDEKDHLEIARHGIAILFDLLRHDATSSPSSSSSTFDFMQARRVALNAGLHDVLLIAMKRFSDNTQIMMMGQQMLIATGYMGEMPSFQGTLACMK